MIATKLIIDNNLQEAIPYISEEYPCYTCYEQFDLHPDGMVPWHWHKEIELTLVLEGSIQVHTKNGTDILHAGDGMFFNANVLHHKLPASEGKVCALNHVFDPRIVAGDFNSVFEQQYVKPLIECSGLDRYVFKKTEEGHRRILEQISSIYEMTMKEEYGYPMKARNAFSEIWLALCKEAGELLKQKLPVGLKEERVKAMMLFIHANYQEKISLEQIAQAANISKRECLRSFQEVLNMTPFNYLMEYRVRKAAELLRTTSQSVAECGYACGFSGISYFTKSFRGFKGCTPSEYRKSHREIK